MLLNPNMLYMSKAEKFFFSSAVVLHFSFYGILAISLYFGLPNSYISAGVRCFTAMVAVWLFFASYMNGEFENSNMAIPFFLYMGYCGILLLVTEPAATADNYNAAAYGRLFFLYVYFSYAINPFLLFLLPPKRFFYLANRPSLVYIPSLFSLLVIIILFREMIFGTEELDFVVSHGINRATTKFAMAMVFMMSLYYIVFSDRKFYKLIFAFLGLGISVLSIGKSSSQSLLLSTGLICVIAFVYSLREKKSFFIVLTFAVLGMLAAIPYILTSEAFKRLRGLADIDLYYTYGTGYDVSRIYLLQEGWNTFKSSPIVGGNLYLPFGGYTHFFPMDVLMTCGVLGFPFLAFIFYIMAKGFIVSFRKLPQAYVWMLMFIGFEFSQGFFHGSYVTALGACISMMLAINMMFERFPDGIPDLSSGAPLR